MSLQTQVYKNLTEINHWDENTAVTVADVIGVFERKEVATKNDIKELKDDIKELEYKIEKLDNKIEQVEERLNNKIEQVEERLNNKIERLRDELKQIIADKMNSQLRWTISALFVNTGILIAMLKL